jgi:predicted permease
MSPDEARSAAYRKFGNVTMVREEIYHMNTLGFVETLWRDVRHAWRRLCATPVFALFTALTLALGIGATTAVYSIVRGVLGPTPGVAHIESIVNVYHTPRGSVPMVAMSYGDYLDFRARQTTLQEVTAWCFFRQAFVANGQAETAFGEAVGGEYFQLLGVIAEMGRTLQPADDRPGAPPVVVISHGVWQRLFGGAPDIVGRLIKMNGHNYEIVGVAPVAFNGLFNNGMVPSAMWVPLASVPLLPKEALGYTLDPNQRSHRWLMVKGRLKPGRILSEVAAEVTSIAKQLDAAYPIGQDLDRRYRMPYAISRPWAVRRAVDVHVNETADVVVGPMAWTIMGAAVLVLLVACTNIANLMLARGAARRHELAVRLALGAPRWRLVREILVESTILASAGGIAGLGIARWLLFILGNDLAVGTNISLHLVPQLDPWVIAMSAAATLLTLVVTGLVPALQSTRADLRAALATDGSHTAHSRWRGRRILISAQVAVSVILLSLTALCTSQLWQQSRLDSGIDLEHLALAQVDFAMQGYEEARVRQIVDATLRQMARRPGVDAVAASSGLPVGLGVTTPGCVVRTLDESRRSGAELVAATPGIFKTLGVAIRRGRAFNETDTQSASPVIVVNEVTARALFDTPDVLGRRLGLKRAQWVGESEHPVETMTIVGVAADSDAGSVGRRDRGVVYLPFAQHYEGRLILAARASGDPRNLIGALRQALRSVDPGVAVTQAGTGLAVAGPSSVFLQVTAGLAGVLGSLALVLALAGLYGVLSHVVARRTWEIGVRVALGAGRMKILGMVLRDGLVPVGCGIGAGLMAGIMARMLLRLFFIQLLPALDPGVLTVVPVLMLLAGIVACYLPARRAARVDPNIALKEL